MWVARCANFKMAPAYSRLNSLGNLFFFFFFILFFTWSVELDESQRRFSSRLSKSAVAAIRRELPCGISAGKHTQKHTSTPPLSFSWMTILHRYPRHLLNFVVPCSASILFLNQSMDSALSLFSYLTSWLRIGLKLNKAFLIHISMYSSVLTISLFGILIWTP